MDMLIRLLADYTLVTIVIGGSLALLFGVRRSEWPRLIPVAIMAGLTSLLIGKFMSLLWQPDVARPFIELGVSPGASFIDNPGFPSDHMLLATVVVTAVFMMSRFRWIAYILALLVILMGAGRVLALVHTPIDIIGGLLAGLSGIFWYYRK